MAQIILTIIVAAGVGFMIYRQHKLEQAEKSAQTPRQRARQRDPNDTRDWQAIVGKATELAKLQEKPAVALAPGDGPVSDAPHSSLGGRPSLPSDMPWPHDQNGKPMLFLAQINFSDMPPLEGYPTRGLLSFFVMDDDLNGSEFPSVGDKGFQVHFFDDPTGFARAPLPDTTWEYSPLSDDLVRDGAPLGGNSASGALTPNSHQVADMTQDWYPHCPNALWDDFGDELAGGKPGEVYFGGHPDFVQYDIRREGADPDLTPYTEVLLQMGYLQGEGRKALICWGDAGEACFLITKDDLAARRFDRVIYSWDCG